MILEKRRVNGKKVEYLIKWQNCDENSWQSVDTLEGAEDIIEKFEIDLEAKKENSKLVDKSNEKSNDFNSEPNTNQEC